MKRRRVSDEHWISVPEDVHEWLAKDKDFISKTIDYCHGQLSQENDIFNTSSLLDTWLLGLYRSLLCSQDAEGTEALCALPRKKHSEVHSAKTELTRQWKDHDFNFVPELLKDLVTGKYSSFPSPPSLFALHLLAILQHVFLIFFR